MSQTVGIVGLGIMGGAFARNLLEAGLPVVGYDIVGANVAAIVDRGGRAGNSLRDVAVNSDAVITSLPSIAAFDAVMTGADGLAASAKEGLIVIECSTLPIDVKDRAHAALADAGVTMLDCPISGTGAQAAVRDLSVYGSGDEAAFETCREIFAGIAKNTFYVGEFGNGSKMKFIANHLVHVHNVASAEAMVLGQKAGLDPQVIYDVIKEGAGNSKIFELRGPMMVANDYSAATMKMEIWKKDMQTIGAFAAALDCPVPLFSAAADVYYSGLSKGMQALDTASVCKVLEDMAGIKRD